MNIADAKKHVKDTIEAYLKKDADGLYLISPEKQRPLFLLGAPGIGKTAIMSQISDELQVGLVSYSMTHHTRQSALGLPFIVHQDFEGYEYEASEYTMSEIVASIYDYMGHTGLRRGILFLDEVNCVSETLYPSMLQFLQFKTFGRHSIPDDWVVVCAGNPPEYNRSVHDFDVVTLDRMRKLEVEPDYAVWKAYAVNHGVHPAVLSFLETKPDCFYNVESTPGSKLFVTARGWEDLSQIITLFESMDKPVDLQLIGQFLQDPEISERFALYYDLFRKYRSDYKVADILEGKASEQIVQRARDAAFDERLALIGLILDTVSAGVTDLLVQEKALTTVRDVLRAAKPRLLEGASVESQLAGPIQGQEAALVRFREAKAAGQSRARVATRALEMLKSCSGAAALMGAAGGEAAFDAIHQAFRGYVGPFESDVARQRQQLEHAFTFMEDTFGDDREMLVFMTELSARQDISRFVSTYGCEGYERHDQALDLAGQHQELFDRIDNVQLKGDMASQPQAIGRTEEPKGPLDGAMAAYYDKANFEFGYASLCHMALPADLKGKTVLDIGCRRGKGVFKVSERVGASGRAIGVDWNAGHVDEALRRMDRAWRDSGLPANNMEFHCVFPEDLVACGLGGESVDVVFVNSVLHLTYDPKQVLREMHRVLRIGGTAVFEIALANAVRDPLVVQQARELGNSVQAAPFKDDFVACLHELGFSDPRFGDTKEVPSVAGYKVGAEVPAAPSDEEVSFLATVITVTKLS